MVRNCPLLLGITEKVKIIGHTTVQHVTQYEAEIPEIQQIISKYH